MKQFIFNITFALSALIAPLICQAQHQSISMTASDCNPEALRNKAALDSCIEAVAENLDWELPLSTHVLHTDNGLIVIYCCDSGSIIIHCINEKDKALIDIVKLAGKSTSLILKKKIQEILKAKSIKVVLNNRN